MLATIKGKVVVILDAANATGEAVARHLSEEGACLVLGGQDRARLHDLAAELAWDGGRVRMCETDMSQRMQVARLAASAADAFGRIDVMVNNPVLPPDFPYDAGEPGAPDLVAGIHALGAIHGAAAAFAHMKRRRAGHIITVAPPIPAGGAGWAVEQATRRALSHLSACLRSQAEKHGICTTLVAPSPSPAAALPAATIRAGARLASLAHHAAAVARAVAFAAGQPAGMDVAEILLGQAA